MSSETNPPTPIYTPRGVKLGIVTAADIEQDELALRDGEDPYPEHYRWRRFVSYLKSRDSIDPEQARSLYELGENDSDHSQGGSIMAAILRRDDCPGDLYEKALHAGRDHLVRIAKTKLGVQNA